MQLPVTTDGGRPVCPSTTTGAGVGAIKSEGSDRSLAIERDHPVSNRELRQPRHRMDIQSAHDSFSMSFNGPDTNAQFAGNLLVALALGDQYQYFALA